MEKESFEDTDTAAFLNTHYVSIKVDREERPDIDNIYMSVCQAVTGQGGWPLSIVMTPSKEPFFTGTYLPKKAKWGRPGLIELLTMLVNEWQQNRDKIVQIGKKIVALLEERHMKNTRLPYVISEDVVHKTFEQLLSDFDLEYGGFGNAPKFPTPHNLMFLLRYFYRNGDKRALSMVVKTLEAMSRGGIYDHLGYGFARYSTDRKWFIPHFEKMLYDNALLCYVFVEAYQCSANQEMFKISLEIAEYVLRDMTGDNGEFFSAEDADSEGKEGNFYVWTHQEIINILGEEKGALFADVYGITKDGNFEEGKNILNLIAYDLCEYAVKHQLDFAKLNDDMAKSREKLFHARKKRIPPFKDDKILTAWNCLMIASLAKAGRVLEREDFTFCARRAMDFIYERLFRADGRLLTRYRSGEADYLGYVDEHAFLLWGLLELYETTFEEDYLEKAVQIAADLKLFFWDEKEGGFFFSAVDGEELIVRSKEIYDGAIPSGNSVAALQLLKLARISGNDEYLGLVERIFECFGQEINDYPRVHTFLMMAVDSYLAAPKQIVIAGDLDDSEVKNMLLLVRKSFLPESVIVFNNSKQSTPSGHISSQIVGQKAIDSQATAYVCENFTCQEPIKSAVELEKILRPVLPITFENVS